MGAGGGEGDTWHPCEHGRNLTFSSRWQFHFYFFNILNRTSAGFLTRVLMMCEIKRIALITIFFILC